MRKSINRAFKFRLLPTPSQLELLTKYAGCCRYVYNWALTYWLTNYNKGDDPTVYDLIKKLPTLKNDEDRRWLQDCPAQSLQQAIVDLGTALDGWRRLRKRPKYRKKNWNDSFRLAQYFKLNEESSELVVPKLGAVKYIRDRRINGVPRSLTIVKEGDLWFVSVLCELNLECVQHTSSGIIGIDVGVANMATTWDGEKAQFHQHQPSLSTANEKVRKYHRQLSRKIKGSRNRDKVRSKLSKAYRRVTRIRKDTLHKLSRKLVTENAVIALEALSPKQMSAKGGPHKRGLNRSIMNQGWSELVRMIGYKSVETGSVLVLVDPKYTSQTCPKCQHCEKTNRKSQSVFICNRCGFNAHADIVAAMNIRARVKPEAWTL